jgi:hypothetical protein
MIEISHSPTVKKIISKKAKSDKMREIKKGTILSEDKIVLEEEEAEFFLQFKRFYKDYESGIFQERLAKRISDFVQTPAVEEGEGL